MIKSIVFDWGGVLIEEPSPEIFAFCAKALHISTKKFLQIYEKYKQDFQRGTISEAMLWSHLCREAGIQRPPSLPLWGTAFRQAYREKTEIFNLASLLQKNGYRIGFLSNTEYPGMEFFLERHYPMFDVTVFSCAEGTRKPEEKIFQILLQRLHVEPRETVFIDDTEEYIIGAEQVGIKTVLFKNTRQLRKALASFSIVLE
jgi:epoxide hydrolase-like predicted phosphatase